MKRYASKNDNDKNDDHPDISHIPNDQPIPSQNPDKSPANIPVDEPSTPEVPGPKRAPVQEPNKNPKIRVLNIQY